MSVETLYVVTIAVVSMFALSFLVMVHSWVRPETDSEWNYKDTAMLFFLLSVVAMAVLLCYIASTL